jgi:hypothetical protein
MRVKRVNDPAYAMVFVDWLAFRPIFTLNQISTTQIDRIEFLNARDATTLRDAKTFVLHGLPGRDHPGCHSGVGTGSARNQD